MNLSKTELTNRSFTWYVIVHQYRMHCTPKKSLPKCSVHLTCRPWDLWIIMGWFSDPKIHLRKKKICLLWTFLFLFRYKLGRTCLRKTPISCVTILNRGFQGSDVSGCFLAFLSWPLTGNALQKVKNVFYHTTIL